MSKRGLVFDVLVLVVWIVILFCELVFIHDTIFTIIAVVGVFVFAAFLGRDVRRARSASM
jgi:hypothetical protein